MRSLGIVAASPRRNPVAGASSGTPFGGTSGTSSGTPGTPAAPLNAPRHGRLVDVPAERTWLALMARGDALVRHCRSTARLNSIGAGVQRSLEAGLRHQLGPASESAHFRFRRWKRTFLLSNLEAGLSNVLRHQLGPRPNLEAQISPPAPRDLPPEPQRGHAETQSPRGSARGSGTRKLNRRRGSATARGSDTRKLKHQLSPASELESANFRSRCPRPPPPPTSAAARKSHN